MALNVTYETLRSLQPGGVA